MSLFAALLLAATPPTTLEQLASDVTAAVTAQPFEAPVGVYVEGSPAPLARALATAVLGRLAARQLAPTPIDARDATEAEARARAHGARTLVRLTLHLEPPRLVVRGDALSTWVNFWSGRTPTRSGPAAVVVAAAAADAQALALAGAPPLPPRPLALATAPVAELPMRPSALALGDVDGDGRAELHVVLGEELVTFAGSGTELARIALTQPPAARPTRDAWGLLAVEGARATAWSGRREAGETFEWRQGGWRSLGSAARLALGPLGLRPLPGRNAFEPEVTWGTQTLRFAAPVQGASLSGELALVTFPDGTAALARGAAPEGRVGGVGAGSALWDGDDDGTPEVVLTAARTGGGADELRVVRLGSFEATQRRAGLAAEAPALWQAPLPARAVLAAVGDVDGDGRDEVALGLWRADGTGHLLLLRSER